MKDIDPKDVLRGQFWYYAHTNHVDSLIAHEKSYSYPPNGSDALHPELWKPASWVWFKDKGYIEQKAPSLLKRIKEFLK